MGSRKQYLFNQIVAADPSKNNEDVYNGDLEETYHQMMNAGLLGPGQASLNATYANVKTVSASYGDGIQDATAHIQGIINAANAAGVGVYVPRGIYKITAVLDDVQRMRLAEGATITAGTPGMAAVLRTRIGTRLDGGYIVGKGTIDANTNAAIGIHVRDFLHHNIEGVYVTGGNTAAIKAGQTGSSGRSAESVITGVRLFNAGTVVVGSQGILAENSGDHSFSQIIIQNYETGIVLPAGGNAIVHDVHVWSDPAKGVTKIAFLDNSNNSHYNSCAADSPTQFGWRLYGYNTTLTQCTTYLNPGVTQIVDNTVVGIKFESAGSVATIIGHAFNGGSGALRLSNDILAQDANYTSVVYMGCTNSFVVALLSGQNKINDLIIDSNTGTKIANNPAQKIGFYGTAPIVRPSLTYSRATETAASTQLRTTLVALGLVTDSTVA